MYHKYSLYYLVLCVSSYLCALYLYYLDSPTKILCVLAAPTQLVPAITYHRTQPLKSQYPCSSANEKGGVGVGLEGIAFAVNHLSGLISPISRLIDRISLLLFSGGG